MEHIELYAQLHPVLAYFLVFFGTFIEGEFVLITAGILAHIGVLDTPLVITFGLLGAFAKIFFGYFFGTVLRKWFPNSLFLLYIEKKILYFFPFIKERQFLSIFLSKFIYGINHLTLVFAGFSKFRFKTFLIAETLSTLVWFTGIQLLSYFFSITALSITKDFKKASLIIFSLLIFFVCIKTLAVFLYKLYVVKEERK